MAFGWVRSQFTYMHLSEYMNACIVFVFPTKAEGRRVAYHGFSNASLDSAVMTHMWKRDVIGARLYCLSAATHLTCVFAFNRPNNHGQQQSHDRKP